MKKSMKKVETEKKREPVFIQDLCKDSVEVILMGDSPLLVHAWSQKGKLEMLKKHMKEINIVREAKDPYDHFLRSMYRFEDGRYGFPVVGVKEAMATATIDLKNIAKTELYRNVFVKGERGFELGAFANLKMPRELAELMSPNPPQMREDIARIGGKQGVPDLRYRAEFWPWAIKLKVIFLSDFITLDSVLNLMHHAGFKVGLGDWRQEKGGVHGSFHIADEKELKLVRKWAIPKQPEVIDAKKWLASLKQDEQSEGKKGRSKSNGSSNVDRVRIST